MAQTTLIARAKQWLHTKTSPAMQVRRFQGATVGNTASQWLATANSINQELRYDLDLLRRRARELVNNNDYAAKFAGMVKDNIIGHSGIRLQMRVEDKPGQPDNMANDAVEAAWLEWSQSCDVTGRMSFTEFCTQLVGSLPADGEFLVRIIKGTDAGNRFNFALQVIDVDRIDTTYNGISKENSNTVIMGVEVNAYRKPVALHVFEAHPNDGERSSRRRVRISMDETLHCFRVTRPEQMRGIPWVAPGMLSLHHLGGFKLSALLAAEHGANHFGFFTTPDGQQPGIENEKQDGQAIMVSQPGTFDTLPAGTSFQAYDSKYPEQNFGPFVKTTLQRIATGWRVAYHSLANDLEGVSFSSIRSGTLEERDRWMADQEWFINVFMEPVFRQWLQFSLLSGAITMPNGSALPAAKIAKFSKHEWQPRRWEWVDPQVDMNAKILAVKAGIMAPQDLSASMGLDFEDTIKAIGQAQKLAKLYDVQLTAYDGAPGAQTAANAGAQPAVTPAAKALPETHHKDLSDTLELLGRAIDKPSAPVNVSVGVNSDHIASMAREMKDVATGVMNQIREVHENMPIIFNAPNVTVEAIMPEVRSAAPVVNITNEVPAAQVTVVDNHPTRAVQKVERDANDEIVQTVTTYER
jgi:lambda family phage portal protein